MHDPADLDRLAEDWIALWQSEIAGLAADPELAEQWAAWAALGAAWMRAATAMRFGATPHDRAAAPPWTPPAAPAPGPGGDAGVGSDDKPGRGADDNPGRGSADDNPGRGSADDNPGRGSADDKPGRTAMADRLAELERRLADLEGGPGGAKPDPGRPRRRRPRA